MYNIKNYLEINYSKYLFIPTNPNSDNGLMYGGLASAITGGDFAQGAAIGLVVTALNHALHEALDPNPTQQQKGNEKKVKTVVLENKVWDLDGDGRLSLNEANRLTKILPNKPNVKYTINIDLNKLDLSNLYSEDFWGGVNSVKTANLLFASNRLNDGLVFENIRLRLYPDNMVKAFGDKYDFDMKSWLNPLNWVRNFETIIGSFYAGNGTPFYINLNGFSQIKAVHPIIK